MSSIARTDIPGPSGPDMLRGIPLMRSNPPLFLHQCRERFGDVVAFPIPRSTVVFLAAADDVRHVLQQNHPAYGKRTIQYDALATVTGHGLLASDDALWRRMRRVQQPAFRTDLVNAMAGAAVGHVDRLMARWSRLRPQQVIDVEREMSALTMDIVGTTLFGNDIRNQSARLVHNISVALDVAIASSRRPFRLPVWFPLSGSRTLQSRRAGIDGQVRRLVSERRSQPQGSDVLSLLLEAEDSGVVSRDEVRNEVVTLIVAGHETVATALTWTWSLLADRSDVVARIRAEADLLPGQQWADQAVTNLPYTRAVVDESLRLFPPAWVISRRSTQPDMVGGYLLPEGTTVITSPYLLHRDARSWVDPSSFDPSRFLDTDLRLREVYLPFGVGPRQCIGRELALLEATLIVARVAQACDVEPLRLGLPTPEFAVTVRPRGGLPAIVKRRNDRQT